MTAAKRSRTIDGVMLTPDSHREHYARAAGRIGRAIGAGPCGDTGKRGQDLVVRPGGTEPEDWHRE
jgi:hypothetical protein